MDKEKWRLLLGRVFFGGVMIGAASALCYLLTR